MIFRSYKKAHEYLGIPGSYQRGTHGTALIGVSSLKITVHPDSYYVGKGNKPTPAHPIKTQSSDEQDVFRKSIETQKKFPVLYKYEPHKVKLLGYYRVVNLKKSKRGEVTFYYAILKKI